MSHVSSGSASRLLEVLGYRLGSAALLDALPVGIVAIDRDGAFAFYNRRAVELWGQDPGLNDSAVRARMMATSYDFPEGKPVQIGQAPSTRVLMTKTPVRDERFIMERPDGSRVTVLVNVDPLLDDDGSLLGAVSVFQDVSSIASQLDSHEVDLAHLGAIVESSETPSSANRSTAGSAPGTPARRASSATPRTR